MQKLLREFGVPSGGPSSAVASTAAGMRDVWTSNRLESVEVREIRIRVAYADFDDFWDTNSIPVGPAGTALAKFSPENREKLKVMLRERLPTAADGSIAYEAFANAVKGRVPA